MEYGYSVAPSHGPVYDEHPQGPLYDDKPANTMVVGDEEEHPEEMSVKEKVKKMEDIITTITRSMISTSKKKVKGITWTVNTSKSTQKSMMPLVVLDGRDKHTELNSDELGASPDVINSLHGMAISEQLEVQQRDQQCIQTPSVHEDESHMGHVSSDVEKKPSYSDKLSLTAAAAKDAAVSGTSMVYSKIAGTVSGQTKEPTRQTLVETMKKSSYTKRLSSTAAAAKDVAVSAASTVYAKVAGKEEGTHFSEELIEGDAEKKGSYTEKLSGTTLMREYLVEKLRPGEEDRALCELISDSMHNNREEEEVNVEQKETIADWDRTIGEGMVDEVRCVVTSLVGRDGANSGASPLVAKTHYGEKDNHE